MKCSYFSSFLLGLALMLSLFTAGCKKTEDALVSPLAPPAWIQGSWASPDYDNVGSFGWRWEFSQDNAICYFYRQGQPFLAPLDFFQLVVDCQKGVYDYTCRLSDTASDAFYEIEEILEYKATEYQQDTRYRFTKLTPTTLCYENICAGQATIGIVFTKQEN